MSVELYVVIEKGMWWDGFFERPLKPVSGEPTNPTWRGTVWITDNVMRIAPNGGYGALYDYEVLPATPESIKTHNEWHAGYEHGKAQKRRCWPTGEVSDVFKDGYRKAWEDKGKPFDDAYWKQYWRNR